MNNPYREAWEQAITQKYGSVEAYKKLMKEKKWGFQKGRVPPNKIQDEFTDMPISRQRKYLKRKSRAEDES